MALEPTRIECEYEETDMLEVSRADHVRTMGPLLKLEAMEGVDDDGDADCSNTVYLNKKKALELRRLINDFLMEC